MEQVSDKSSFQIILRSDSVDNLSEYWQNQCWYLYDEISRALPEGSIKPLTLEGVVGEKADILVLFSHPLFIEITTTIFVEIIFAAIKNWHYYRPDASIEIICPDGSIAKITKQSLPKLQKHFDENTYISICEALSLLKTSHE